MRSAVVDMAKFSDNRLFKEISEGITHIVENAVSLDDTANRLCQAQEYRAAAIFGGFAEEEAAKVPILIDAVRCPSNRLEKAETLKCFYNHVAKRIYTRLPRYAIQFWFLQVQSLEVQYRNSCRRLSTCPL